MIRITRTVIPAAVLQNYITGYPAFIALVKKQLNPACSALFASPVVAADGAIEWYSELKGEPKPLEQLTEADKARVEALLIQRLAVVEQLYQRLSAANEESADLLAMLALAYKRPNDAKVWVIEGQPVIVDLLNSDIIPATPVVASVKKRAWWPWLMLLVLLFALMILLLRRCQPSGEIISPDTAAVSAGPAPEAASVKMLCPERRTKEQAPEMIMVFDGSVSMALSMDVTPDELQLWMENKSSLDIEREPRRITLARRSAKQIVDALPADMNVNLIAAADCKRVTTSKTFSFQQRSELKKTIDGIEPTGKTPLAEALMKAGKLVDGVKRDAIILLITDGEETCGGDPCEVARQLKMQKPRLQVNVVDILNTGAGNCIASNTGGQVFAINSAHEFNQIMNEAVREYIPQGCE